MKEYIDAIYNHLAVDNNGERYKIARELNDLFPNIEKRIRGDFWHAVHSAIIENIKPRKTMALVCEHKLADGFEQIRLGKPEWGADLCICFEAQGNFTEVAKGKVYYGIQINKCAYRMPAVNGVASRAVEELPHFEDNEPRWLSWEYIHYDFEKEEHMYRILPTCREQLVDELADLLLKYAGKYSSLCDSISKLHRPV